MPPTKTVQPRSRAGWRGWLERNHARSDGIWLVSFKKTSGKQRLRRRCLGWDSLRPAARAVATYVALYNNVANAGAMTSVHDAFGRGLARLPA
ncbi:MAG TPA: hypothetical protein VGB64_02055 [Actinomycetota bacterium]